MMKKLIVVVLSALLLMTLLISCGSNGNATPGNLVPTAKPTPHLSTGEKEISSEYIQKLCTEDWLDTSSLHCCSLNEDGTYIWMQSRTNEEQIASGSWRLTLDDQDYLSLYLTDDSSGKTQVLHEIELFDASIYATDDSGNTIVWLMIQTKAESDT